MKTTDAPRRLVVNLSDACTALEQASDSLGMAGADDSATVGERALVAELAAGVRLTLGTAEVGQRLIAAQKNRRRR